MLPSLQLTYKCACCHELTEISIWDIEVFDDDTVLVCSKCQGQTRVHLIIEDATIGKIKVGPQRIHALLSLLAGNRRKRHALGETVTSSIGELINTKHGVRRKVRSYPLSCVYIVRDKDKKPLYVGMTAYQAHYRIVNHIQIQSPLGKAIREQSPESYEWEVEIIKTANRKHGQQREKQLIEELRPLYNVQGKPTDGH